MENIIIRRATINDMDTLLDFEQGIMAAERPFDPTLKPKTHYYDIPEMIAADHIELLVAELNGELIGSGYARIEEAKHYLQHRQHSYLGFMFTHPDHRGKGVNKMIIESLKQWSLSRNITEIRLEVYCLNESAIKAYEKVGFIRHMMWMRMEAL